ncbi:hypothetical protein ACLESO_08690 [Pyxidicoccus sp. 3LG]
MHQLKGRLLATVLVSIAAGCQGEGTDSAQETLDTQEANATQCVQRFNGILSCAIGNALLTPTPQGLHVSRLNDVRQDGLASRFGKASKWSQDSEIRLGGAQGRLELAARSGDQVVSTLRIAPGPEANSAAVLPTFTGSPGGSAYRMSVYRDGALQGLTLLPGGRIVFLARWINPEDVGLVRNEFFQEVGAPTDLRKNGVAAAAEPSSVGACAWRMRNNRSTFSVTLDDGRVLTGNELLFTEVIADGHYPYTDFTGIDVKATANGLTVLGESVVPAP